MWFRSFRMAKLGFLAPSKAVPQKDRRGADFRRGHVSDPNWTNTADAFGEVFDFAADCYKTAGLTRQIGTAQNGSDPERPVELCIPARHFYQSTVQLSSLISMPESGSSVAIIDYHYLHDLPGNIASKQVETFGTGAHDHL